MTISTDTRETDAPNGMQFVRADDTCEVWTLASQIGAIDIVFYTNGQVVLNTAPYDLALLEWITTKARQMAVAQ